jgi:restriction system protein
LGSFSKGCQEVALFTGAAPIGLINGEKLLDLLIENQIGVRLRPAELYELDDSFFAPADVSSAAAEDAQPETSALVE